MLVSKEIREEREALVNDPVILELALEIVGNGDRKIDTGDWVFIRGAYNEYKSRGGTAELRTLGAPAAAIGTVLDRINEIVEKETA